jgi:hypothetical protein
MVQSTALSAGKPGHCYLSAIAGAGDWEDAALFGTSKEKWLKGVLLMKLPHGVPSADTYRRVFAALDAE